MSHSERISIITIGVIVGVVMGLIYKDLSHFLIVGVLTSSVITIMLSKKEKSA